VEKLSILVIGLSKGSVNIKSVLMFVKMVNISSSMRNKSIIASDIVATMPTCAMVGIFFPFFVTVASFYYCNLHLFLFALFLQMGFLCVEA
jgi:hypothetical protein